ncbi:YD repeat protein [Candidatus Vecturithrix granuli]|uniref:YD repeat protein n=1 Tax=Vecturithrix granuli TaxID=1499967 RepID=A0A081BTX0_VECG1|nr:YD repeat protein [Candidatus Vecturithrix granuli]
MFTAEYDAENRITSLAYTDSSGMAHRQEFLCSGDNLLAEQKFYENGVLVDTLRIIRDGMLVIQDRDGNNAVLREYTWGLNLGGGIGGLLNLKQGGQNYAYLYDGKGNVEAILDSTQAVVAAYRYDPFGVLLNQTGSLNQPYAFSTKRYNAPVGMVQYEARNYFPEIVRWDSRDPIGEAGGLNLYAFVGNNPVNWIDPYGQRPKLTIIINLGDNPIYSSYSNPQTPGQVVFPINPGRTSITTNNDPDTLIFADGTVVKIPDYTTVVIKDSDALNTFEESDLRYISPLGQLIDDLGLIPLLTGADFLLGPKIILDPETEFGGPFVFPEDDGPCK